MMLDKVKLSVIIPCFNGGELIDKCLLSICNQTFESFEIIIVDDCSTDQSLEVLQKWEKIDDRIKALKNEVNSGAGYSRNRAILEARGEYITFVDIDDYLYDEFFFEDCIRRFDESTADILVTPFYRYQDSRYRKDRFRMEGYYSGYRAAQRYLNRDFGTHASTAKFYRKSRLKPAFVECGFSQDVLFVFKALMGVEKVYAYPRYGYVYYNDNISAWRPVSITTEHVLSSLRLLMEVMLMLDSLRKADVHINPEPFLESWNREHGERLNTYTLTYGGLGFRQLDAVMKDHWDMVMKHISDENIQSAIRRNSQDDIEANQELVSRYASYLEKLISENQQAATSQKLIRGKDISMFRLPYEVIVSLTSYPKRIHIVHKAIQSLLNQTVKVRNIILWLSDEDFPNREKDLPDSVTNLVGKIFRIRWCPNLKPHKKYFYAMKEAPDSIIITVDDDVYYPNDLIEDLIRSYIRNPDAISAKRCHLITFDEEGELMPYAYWIRNVRNEEIKSIALIPTGVGGVLYPPGFYDESFFDESVIRKTCLNQDDLWLKMIGIRRNIPVVTARNLMRNVLDIEDSQEDALWAMNLAGENDTSIQEINRHIIKEYGNGYFNELLDRVRKESILLSMRVKGREGLFEGIQFSEFKLRKYKILSKVCFWGKRDYYKYKYKLMNFKKIMAL